MFIVTNRYVLARGYRAIALWPFVVLKDKRSKEDVVLLNHERIHLRQQIELLILPFYLWYGVEYLIRLIQYRNRFLAYRNISFEREAYENETNLDYLKRRSFWGFLKDI